MQGPYSQSDDLPITYEQHVAITRFCARMCMMSLQFGAESTLVHQLTHRLGVALGMDSVECALTPNATVLTARYHHRCVTTTRSLPEISVNMHVITELQRLVLDVEHGDYSVEHLEYLEERLNAIRPVTHHPWLVLVMVALGCASFARLAGANWIDFWVTFLASAAGMRCRQLLASWRFNTQIVFGMSAFVAILVAGFCFKWIDGSNPNSHVALASSVLFLVPGFPFITSMSDMLKGYVSMGISRWMIATLLTLGACVGIVFALQLLSLSWNV